MVSIGTIFSVSIVGAIIAGGVAVYANRSKLGGAFSRGVETTLTAPLGNYFDNLWKGVVPGASTAQSNTQTKPNPTPLVLSQPGAGKPNPADHPTNPTPTDVIVSGGGKAPPTQTINDPNLSLDKFQPKVPSAGYYYFNYVGKASGYDRQQYLSKSQAKQFTNQINVLNKGGLLQDVKYLGTRKLGTAGFNLIGKANNYL